MSGQTYSGANQPPEHGEPRTDPWGWLYREDGQVEPAAGARPPADQTGETTQPYRDPQLPPPYPPEPSTPDPGPPVPVYPSHQPAPAGYGFESPSQIPAYPTAPTAYAPTGPTGPTAGTASSANPPYAVLPTGEEEPPRRRGLMVGLIIGALALVVVIALVLINLSQSMTANRPPATTPGGQPSAGASSRASAGPSTPAAQQTYDGKVTALTATGATANCVAPDATDGNGDPVSYAAVRAVDGDLDSAWRCDGTGIGESIRVTVPAGSQVARLGLVNGYTKVDPATDTQRYPEYRRITRVRWELSTGASFEQTLADKTETLQNLAIPVQKDVAWVQVTVESSTAPGSKAATRDAVLISEIQVAAPA